MKAITITINKIDEKEVYHYDYIQDAMDFLNKELKRLTGSYFDNYLGRYYLYVRFKKIGYCFENGGIMYFYDEISKKRYF